MTTEKNILIAFILNLFFSVFEFIGGAITGSVAIVSDAVHDIGDAISIGISFFLEKKSKKQPDDVYTYGYLRYSVIGSIITTVILLFGSGAVIYNAVIRIFNPAPINYNGMILFAVIGVLVNFVAAYFTRQGDSLNQKAVNLHMLEDVLGWVLVLIGAIIMRFTDIAVIDPVMSIFVAVFIFVNAVKNLKRAESVILEKTPANIDVHHLKEELLRLDGVLNVHHIHLWSMDGYTNFATMHIVTDKEGAEIKIKVREFLKNHHIGHATLEIESPLEECIEEHCHINHSESEGGHHHHHHHHH